MKFPPKQRWLIVGSSLAVALVLGALILGPLKTWQEFVYAEDCKGYWASLQKFVNQKGRYPKNEAEIEAFFQISNSIEPVLYVAPHDDSADEVVLWWKQKTLLGVRIGVTESGIVVKK